MFYRDYESASWKPRPLGNFKNADWNLFQDKKAFLRIWTVFKFNIYTIGFYKDSFEFCMISEKVRAYLTSSLTLCEWRCMYIYTVAKYELSIIITIGKIHSSRQRHKIFFQSYYNRDTISILEKQLYTQPHFQDFSSTI